MNEMISRLRLLMQKLFRTGFFSVFFSSVAAKVLTFIGGMIIVRVLSKDAYGQYTYVINCYGMLSLLNDCGCSSAMDQYCSETHDQPEKFNGYFVYGVKSSLVLSAVTALAILFSPLFYPFQEPEAARLSQALCLMPFLNTCNTCLLVNLRVRLQNNRYAKINLFSTLAHYVIILPMSYVIGVTGAVLSNYIIATTVLIYSLVMSRGLLDYTWHSNMLEHQEKRGFLKLAFASQLNNSLNQALMLFDVFLIGVFVGENVVISSYKVATTIPAALAFIPTAIMVYVTPRFARNNQNIAWVRKYFKRLTMACAAGNFVIAAGGILLGPWIVPLIFGAQYADAVTCYSILMIGYFFSATFRTPSANVIYSQHKVRVNIIITAFSGISNCILDVIMILYFGSIGAAIATTAVHIINSALSFGYLCFYLRENTV